VIKKIFRLKERQVRKVLSKWKPFFSYWIVLNFLENKLPYNRFAIIIWWKSIKSSVWRNFFRRKFYNLVWEYIKKNKNDKFFDFVFVVKKQTKLDKKNLDIIKNFEKDLNFLIKKIF
jgi:RNase P protein component